MATTLPDGTSVRVVASRPSSDFYAGWLRGYGLSGPVTRALIAEAEKALAVARGTLSQLQQEAPSAAAVEASGASGATSSEAFFSLLTSTTAELSSTSDRADGFYTPPAGTLGPVGEAFAAASASRDQTPGAAASSDAAAPQESQVPHPPRRSRRDTDPWYSADRADWHFPVGPYVRDPPSGVLLLADQLEGCRSLTHRGGVVSGNERVLTAWRLGLSDRECAVHFYHRARCVQAASPSWLHCKAGNYEEYRRRTHPTGQFVHSVSRGFLTLLGVRIYLQAVACLGTVERV